MTLGFAIALVLLVVPYIALEHDANRRIREGLEPPARRAWVELTPRERLIDAATTIAALTGVAFTVTGRSWGLLITVAGRGPVVAHAKPT
jgi:hypothetical protein